MLVLRQTSLPARAVTAPILRCRGAADILAVIADDKAHRKLSLTADAALRSLTAHGHEDAISLLLVADKKRGYSEATRVAALNALEQSNILFDDDVRDRTLRVLDSATTPAVASAAASAMLAIVLGGQTDSFIQHLGKRIKAARDLRDWRSLTVLADAIPRLGSVAQPLASDLCGPIVSIPGDQTEAIRAMAGACGAADGDVALHMMSSLLSSTRLPIGIRTVIVSSALRQINKHTTEPWETLVGALSDKSNADFTAQADVLSAIDGAATAAVDSRDNGPRSLEPIVLRLKILSNVVRFARSVGFKLHKQYLTEISGVYATLAARRATATSEQLRIAVDEAKLLTKWVSDHRPAFNGLDPDDTLVEALQTELSSRSWFWKYRNTITIVIAACIPAAFLLTFWRAPLLLLRIDKPIIDAAGVTWMPSLIAVPMKAIASLWTLRYHTHVQDTWVSRHADRARQRYQQRLGTTSNFILLPLYKQRGRLNVSGVELEKLDTAATRQIFTSHNSSLLISGEGGIGKTTLAAHLAGLALANDPAQRIRRYRSYPYVFTPDFDGTSIDSVEQTLVLMAAELEQLADEGQAVSPDFVRAMLRSKRIVIIADGVSEMPASGLAVIRRLLLSGDVKSFIATSRSDAVLTEFDIPVVKPARVAEGQLREFVSEYIVAQNIAGFDGALLDRVCANIRLITGPSSTPLMIRLYVDLVAAEHDPSRTPSVPGLMKMYVRYLNERVRTDKIPSGQVLDQAMRLATACCVEPKTYCSSPRALLDLEQTFRETPMPLVYFEERLNLVRLLEPGRDRLRFAIDPLCEYLAAAYLVEQACARGDNEIGVAKIDGFAFRTFLGRVAECVQDVEEAGQRQRLFEALRVLGWSPPP